MKHSMPVYKNLPSDQPQPSAGFNYLWQYAARRQQLYWQRLSGQQLTTDDPILTNYRFTNVYRAADRVSQYLINQVQDDDRWSWPDTFARSLIFKFFNRIDTWQALEAQIQPLDLSALMNNQLRLPLSQLAARQAIYNPAYVMPPPRQFQGPKYQRHLELIKTLIIDDVPSRLQQVAQLQQAFEILRSYSSIGNFLAYQLIIDLNYSRHLNFSEDEFVVPGPGALRGLRKCFQQVSPAKAPALIQWTTQRQDLEFKSRQLAWVNLYGRPLQLIDVQNIFCELDKYTRLLPTPLDEQDRHRRIKQYYRPTGQPLTANFPAKWHLQSAA